MRLRYTQLQQTLHVRKIHSKQMTEDNARPQNKKRHLDIGKVIWPQHNGLRLLNQLQIT